MITISNKKLSFLQRITKIHFPSGVQPLDQTKGPFYVIWWFVVPGTYTLPDGTKIFNAPPAPTGPLLSSPKGPFIPAVVGPNINNVVSPDFFDSFGVLSASFSIGQAVLCQGDASFAAECVSVMETTLSAAELTIPFEVETYIAANTNGLR